MDTTDAAWHRQPGRYEYQAQPEHRTEINVYGHDNVVNHNWNLATEHQWRDESYGEIVRRVIVSTSVAMGTEACFRHLADRGCELL